MVKGKAEYFQQVTFTMISSSQVHIFTILSNIFNSFHAAATFRTKAKSSESVCCRKMKSEPRAPATMYISTRLFVCKKKVPISTWCLHQWHLLSATGMAIVTR